MPKLPRKCQAGHRLRQKSTREARNHRLNREQIERESDISNEYQETIWRLIWAIIQFSSAGGPSASCHGIAIGSPSAGGRCDDFIKLPRPAQLPKGTPTPVTKLSMTSLCSFKLLLPESGRARLV